MIAHSAKRLFAAMLVVSLTLSSSASEKLSFWHHQADSRGELLTEIIADYNALGPEMEIEPVFQGNYDDIFRNTRTSLMAGSPPDIAVAYESMIAEYLKFGEVVDLDIYLRDPEIGYSEKEIADFYPAFLELNRFKQFDNALYSFAFTKSLLILYANSDLIAKAGFDGPPQTWEEFREQCSAMKSIGKKGYAMAVDASTMDGMFMSRGAELFDFETSQPLFTEAPVVETFEFLRLMHEEGSLYQIEDQSEEDTKEFYAGRAAFFLRSSTRRPLLQRSIEEKFEWSMNTLPHGEGLEPFTVLYGANICVFATGEERQRAAWEFLKYLALPEITAKWAIGSGYMPVRRSAAELPAMREWIAEHPVNAQVLDLIQYARPEPSPEGWQQVRGAIERTTVDALIARGGKTPEELAHALNVEAAAMLIPVEMRTVSTGITWIVLAVFILCVIVFLVLGRGKGEAARE